MNQIKKMLRESFESLLKFNNGVLNKNGHNTIFLDDEPIVDFGIGKIGDVEINNEIYKNSIYLQGGFNATKQKRGYGSLGLKFIFNKLPKIENLILQCYDTACPFWLKMGGKVVEVRDIAKSGKPLKTVVINRNNFTKF